MDRLGNEPLGPDAHEPQSDRNAGWRAAEASAYEAALLVRAARRRWETTREADDFITLQVHIAYLATQARETAVQIRATRRGRLLPQETEETKSEPE